jgi:L-iditol 2-dehydrogenase
MRAAIYLGPGQLEIRNVPVPDPGPGEVLVKVRCATTCGTDLKTYRRGHHLIRPPSPFGHEFAGDVVAVGSGVTQFKPGMRVVAHNSAPCGQCFFCRQEQANLCDHILFNFGAFSEFILVPGPIVRLNTFEIPDHLSYGQASCLEPLVSVVHGQRILDIQPGEHVAIIGAGGPIGLMHLQLTRRRGAAHVIAVDLSEQRLRIAAGLGATATLNPSSDDVVAAIHELTRGRGVDVAIEAAGSLDAWQTAVRVVRKGGRVEWFGGLKGHTPIELDSHRIHYGELSLHGTFHGTPLDVQRAFELLVHSVIDTQVLLSQEYPLEGLEEALKHMGEGHIIKALINPDLPPDGS